MKWTEEEKRIEWEERAAILEYVGGLSRQDAEAQATREAQARVDKTL